MQLLSVIRAMRRSEGIGGCSGNVEMGEDEPPVKADETWLIDTSERAAMPHRLRCAAMEKIAAAPQCGKVPRRRPKESRCMQHAAVVATKAHVGNIGTRAHIMCSQHELFAARDGANEGRPFVSIVHGLGLGDCSASIRNAEELLDSALRAPQSRASQKHIAVKVRMPSLPMRQTPAWSVATDFGSRRRHATAGRAKRLAPTGQSAACIKSHKSAWFPRVDSVLCRCQCRLRCVLSQAERHSHSWLFNVIGRRSAQNEPPTQSSSSCCRSAWAPTSNDLGEFT